MTDTTDTDDELTCDRCGEPRPPGSSLCPPCENPPADFRGLGGPRTGPPRTPPHGNTTR